MRTRVLPGVGESIALAAECLREGGVVGMPTETVYGLAANALNDEAVRAVFAAKGRPADNPLIVHVNCLQMMLPLVSGGMPETARRLAEVFWPGPLTMIMKKSSVVAPSVSPFLETVSIRMPSHPVALALIEQCGLPLAAPSANRSGRPSPTRAAHVLEDMDGMIPLILDGGACEYGLESTVIDVTCEPVRILRPGAVTPEMIAAVVGEVEVDPRVLSPLAEGEHPASPGMKYRHYAPKGALTIISGSPDWAKKTISAMYDGAVREGKRCCILALDECVAQFPGREVHSLGETQRDAARNLFDALRQMDALGVEVMLAQGFDAHGMGLALMNRMARAAGFDILGEGELA